VNTGDGIIHISQSKLIALQADARLLTQKKPFVRSNLGGSYRSSIKGRGMEFDESRPYQPGDDIRNMDWRVTARTNKPYSKVFREERERPVLLWVDFRTPMFFGTQQCYKSVQAAKVSATLAWKAKQHGDRVGGLFFSEQQHMEFRPASGNKTVLHMMKQLSEFSTNKSGSTQNQRNGNGLKHALQRLNHVVHPGTLIYMLSDFRNTSDYFETTLKHLCRHNEVVLIHLYDSLESELPIDGQYRVTDGESEAIINTGNSHTKDLYHHRFSSLQQYLQRLCMKSQAQYLSISTADNTLESLTRISHTGQR